MVGINEIEEKLEKTNSTGRHRKKNFYNSIRQQMEFYFGDANLTKDRFLMQLINENPYVPLHIFLEFNKMKKLVTKSEDLVKALEKSQLLELNEDKTSVRRITEIPTTRDADDRTIYVEAIPTDATHDWIIKTFSRFGSVAYVSLPRYKNSKQLKEFGFVEFTDEIGAQKAINAFKEFDGVLCNETNPEALVSITSYEKEQNTENVATEEVRPEKRKRQCASSSSASSCSDSEDSMTAKRFKLSDDDEELSGILKKKRKHRKKKSNKAQEQQKNKLSGLKIMHKRDWKRLRNKYLNLQREKIAEIKRQISRQSVRTPKSTSHHHHYYHHHHQHHRHLHRQILMKSPRSMNFYKDTKCNQEETKTSEPTFQVPAAPISAPSDPSLRSPQFQCERGVILNIKLQEPCVDTKAFKTSLRAYPQVKYIDIKEGDTDAFIRCDTPYNTQKLNKQMKGVGRVLQGDQETAYWDKIMKDRNAKLTKNVKVKSKRGREKVQKAIATHVRFDDDE